MESRTTFVPKTDHVVGSFGREGLSTALASIHRAGFGPQTRVFDGARAHAGLQLERAGLEIREGAPPAADALLVVVMAPGRTAIVAELFQGMGAMSVALAGRRNETTPVVQERDVIMPDIRIGADAASGPDA